VQAVAHVGWDRHRVANGLDPGLVVNAPLGYRRGGHACFVSRHTRESRKIGIAEGAFYWVGVSGAIAEDVFFIHPKRLSLPAATRFPVGTGTFRLMLIPLWIPFLLFAAYPTIAFIRGPVRRWRRRRGADTI
jgi:hypothetical protein